MKFGFRRPSLRRRIAARTSVKRYVRHNLKIKAPRGLGIFTNPKRAIYNRAYVRLTVDPVKLIMKIPQTSWGPFTKPKTVVIGGVLILLYCLAQIF